ncbi:hypothetical protein J7E87_30475 [Streptomyces sp. ISL-1]|uniref:hypothetical protein n=1 Tax=Streptomyces sp. ISL-1 TaxID=2817657 RepID=UPI001BEB7804|nr:hypothetical protein [Streptomyces sp. ISL-1]MBT2393618.1 hypothetical protein [Streptomyces sp. ISL-1]
MKAAIRSLALSALLVAGLTGCVGETTDASSSGGQTERQNGDSLEGHEDDTQVTLSAEQLRVALPSDGSLPAGWIGGFRSKSRVEVGPEAADECGGDTGTSCAGLTAVGKRRIETPEDLPAGDRGASVHFTVYAFGSVEDARVAMKGLVKTVHAGTEGQIPTSPLKISAGADETDAFSQGDAGDYSTDVMLRVGATVVRLWGSDLKATEDMQVLAKYQVDRLVKTAEGKNPDA